MAIAKFFQRRNRVQGLIAYYKLADWWSGELKDDERARILEVFRPIGSERSTLVEGTISAASETSLAFFTHLSGWFKKDSDREIGYKVLSRAEELVPGSLSALDRHFFFQAKIEMHYRDRDEPHHLAEAELACRSQIGIAQLAANEFSKEFPGTLPEHVGYKQLTMLLHSRGAKEEAVAIARQALSEGWSGDWLRHIERYTRK